MYIYIHTHVHVGFLLTSRIFFEEGGRWFGLSLRDY